LRGKKIQHLRIAVANFAIIIIIIIIRIITYLQAGT